MGCAGPPARQSSELYLTGKRWNKLYKLRLGDRVQGAYKVKQWEGKFGPPPVDWVPGMPT